MMLSIVVISFFTKIIKVNLELGQKVLAKESIVMMTLCGVSVLNWDTMLSFL